MAGRVLPSVEMSEVLKIRKLNLYLVYFKLYVCFEWSLVVPLENNACATTVYVCETVKLSLSDYS